MMADQRPLLRTVRLCPACGHATYKHRTLGPPVNAGAEYDPCPCWALVPDAERRCGCTTIHTLASEGLA